MAASRQNKTRKTLIVIVCLTIIPLASIFGIMKFQDWQVIKRLPKPEPSIGPENPPGPESFSPGRAVSEQQAVTEIEIATAQQVGTRVEDDELVLGVVIDGEARAYSINMMTGPSREVFNDSLAGQPIAATW